MTECPDDNQLVAYGSGALPEAESRALERHLDGCEGCRTLAAEALRDEVPFSRGASTPEPPAPEVALGPGSVLGRYVVLARIGAGGMGTVYSAYDPTLERRVALKLLHAEARTSEDAPTAQARLLREAQAMARLAHPNVVSIYDVGTWGDRVFLAMEFVDGGTLRTWLAREHRTRQQIIDALVQAGRGLQAAHDVGLVHRDFKPDNVLVGSDGRVLVTDFGLAHAQAESGRAFPDTAGELRAVFEDHPADDPGLQNSTQAGALVGTPAYMSPEQLLRKPADAQSDQFAFCVTAWEALTGQRPFDLENLRQLAVSLLLTGEASVAEDAPQAPTARTRPFAVRTPLVSVPQASRLPSYVVVALQKGLRLDPAQRHPSLATLVRQLEVDHTSRRRARWMTAVVSVVLLAGAGVGLAQWSQDRALRCTGGAAQIAERWGATEQQGLTSRFQEVAGDFGADAARRVSQILTERGERWASMNREACEATRVRAVQGEDVLTLRMACLDRRLQEFEGLVRLFQSADRTLVKDAVPTALKLPDLEACADLEGLLAPIPLPTDPKERAQVERRTHELANVRVLLIAGQYRKGLKAAGSLWEQVRELRHAPTRAEARLLLGTLLRLEGQPEQATANLVDAALDAERGKADALRAEATMTLASAQLDQHRAAEAQASLNASAAILTRLGTAPVLRARLHTLQGILHSRQGATAQAVESFRHALTDFTAVFGIDSPSRATALTNLASELRQQGRAEEARALLTEALGIEARHFGADHPTLVPSLTVLAMLQSEAGEHDQALATIARAIHLVGAHYAPTHRRQVWVLDDRAVILHAAGRVKEALKVYRESLALKEQLLPAGDPSFSYSFDGVGQCLLDLGRAHEAVPYLERSVALVRNDFLARGDTRFALARALSTLRREPERVESLLDLALEDFAAALNPDKQAAVRAWREARLAKR